VPTGDRRKLDPPIGFTRLGADETGPALRVHGRGKLAKRFDNSCDPAWKNDPMRRGIGVQD